MKGISQLRRMLAVLFHRDDFDRELEREMQRHLEMQAEENEQDGMSADEARHAAKRRFGNVTLLKETGHEMWGWSWLDRLSQDLSYAFRMMRRSPGFTAIAILSLGLGIGVNTTIFSMVNMMVLRPLAATDPDRLVVLDLKQKTTFPTPIFSYPEYCDIRELAGESFSELLAFRAGLDGLSGDLDSDARADRIITHYVTGNYFTMLGVRPALGRLILPSEGQPEGAGPLLVLGHSYWQTRFAGDPNIVGKKVLLNGQPMTVAGVAPKQFHGAQAMVDVQAYVPLPRSSMEGRFFKDAEKNRSLRYLYLLGRLAPGVTLRQAQARLKVVAQRLSDANPKDLDGVAILAQTENLARARGGDIVGVSVIFLGMAALVLVLACVNLANLLMVRATARQKEIGMRAALGGSRGRLIRQLLTESFLLAFLGAAAGLILSIWTSSMLSSLKMQGVPIYLDFSLDMRVLGYAFGTAILAGLMLGILPALRASRVDLAAVSNDSAQRVAGGRQRMRSALVMAQVAVSFVLLIVAGLLTRSLKNAQFLDLGFDARGILSFTLDPGHMGYDEARGKQFYAELSRRVRSLPGVTDVSFALSGPMSAYPVPTQIQIDGYVPPKGQSAPSVMYDLVSRDFFQTLRMPIVRGQGFAETTGPNAPRVAVVNQALAERYWPGRDPIGRKFQFVADPDNWIQVAGVVRDSRYLTLSQLHQPYFFLSLEQTYESLQTLEVRAQGNLEIIIAEVEKEIAAAAPGLPVSGGETMLHQMGSSPEYLGMRLEAGFAAALGSLGLALALLGLYGVVSYGAAQRTREIGVRMALGAHRNDIRKLVLARGLLIVAVGLPAGLLLSFATTPVLDNLLLNVRPTDPLTFIAVAIMLAIVALAACYIPARRAMRIQPSEALRIE